MNLRWENDWNSNDKQLLLLTMQIDNTTYADLSIFQTDRRILPFSANWIVHGPSAAGYNCWNFSTILSVDLKNIRQTQEILRIILKYENEWAPSISNGTIMVMERFYETHWIKFPPPMIRECPDVSAYFMPRIIRLPVILLHILQILYAACCPLSRYPGKRNCPADAEKSAGTGGNIAEYSPYSMHSRKKNRAINFSRRSGGIWKLYPEPF